MAIVKGTEASESGALPDGAILAAMGRFNEELAQAASCSRGRASSRAPAAFASGSRAANGP